jgi:hypothetical protein
MAYRVIGDGTLQLVFCHWAPPIDHLSDDPGCVRVRRRLGTFSRTLWFDPRGVGASKGDPRDSRAGNTYNGDRTAILDAVGFERPAMVGNRLSAQPIELALKRLRLPRSFDLAEFAWST